MRDHDLRKNVLEFPRVLCASRELVSASLGEECVSINVVLKLLDENNELKEYESYCICKKDEEIDAMERLKEFNGLSKEEYIKNNPYCHFCTYPVGQKDFYISFNEDDNVPCKAEFSEGYNYLDYFFYKFNKFRNKLIDNKEVVKIDDLEDYLFLVLENGKKDKKDKEEVKESVFQKVKKRFVNSK